MVSDDLHYSKNLDVQHQCGDTGGVNLINYPNRTSLNESTKSKIGNEIPSESVDTSDAKDESADAHSKLNCTYSCDQVDKSSDAGSSADGSKVKTHEELSVEEIDDDDEQKKKSPWKCKNLFSLVNNLDAAAWSESLCDLKMENLTFEESKIADSASDSMLIRVRNYLAEYQEMRGMSRGDYTYSNLIKVISQATGRCLLALFYVVVNIAPVLEIFLHVLRFIFDTMIDIKNTTDAQQALIKTSLFFVQLISIYICIAIIFGFIIWPVIQMTFGILMKIMFYD